MEWLVLKVAPESETLMAVTLSGPRAEPLHNVLNPQQGSRPCAAFISSPANAKIPTFLRPFRIGCVVLLISYISSSLYSFPLHSVFSFI